MPEVLTKHPEVVLEVLTGGGARCGGAQERKILKKCPPERFCSTKTGETCVYGLNEIDQMTQLSKAELAALVCPTASRSSLGCAVATGPGGDEVPEMLGIGALAILALVMLGVVARYAKARRQT